MLRRWVMNTLPLQTTYISLPSIFPLPVLTRSDFLSQQPKGVVDLKEISISTAPMISTNRKLPLLWLVLLPSQHSSPFRERDPLPCKKPCGKSRKFICSRGSNVWLRNRTRVVITTRSPLLSTSMWKQFPVHELDTIPRNSSPKQKIEIIIFSFFYNDSLLSTIN